MEVTVEAMLVAVRDVGSTGLLALAVIGGFRRWYVWWWNYDQVLHERDDWKATALKALHVAEKITSS
jgi:hypothetical protein